MNSGYLVILENCLVRVKVLAPDAEKPLAKQTHLKQELRQFNEQILFCNLAPL